MDYLSKNVPFFRQDYLRLFEIVNYLHYLRLFWINANYLWIICFGLFVDYLKHGLFEIICVWIICGLFVLDYLRLFVDYLWIFVLDYLRLFEI